MKQVIITIDSQGNPTIETKGFIGQGCKAGSKWAEGALGQKLTDKATADMYAATVNQQRAAQ
jgi:hypothetical protein